MRHPPRHLVSGLAAATALLHVSGVAAARFNFINRCPFLVNMWDNSVFTEIQPRTGMVSLDAVGYGLMWRHGYDPEATLAEVTVDRGRVWYDISVIPPGTGDCTSYDDCHAVANGRRGFNVALAMIPKSNLDSRNCRALICLTDHCVDAFLYPYDNLKVHSCPDTTAFDIIFCPGGIVDLSVPSTTHPPMPRGGDSSNANANANANANTNTNTNANTDVGDTSGYTPARFEYRGAQAGNVPGSYNRVTDLATCARQRVDVVNPVGPLSEEVTLVFRGPMEIYNIAVYAAAPDSWPRLSWYSQDGGGLSDNLLFFNNKNVDYSGLHRWGPQTFASWDGNGTSSVPTKFSGTLGEASDVSQIGGGPGIDTGVEVNILTAQRCGITDCRGFSGGDFSYRGWGGDRKIFVTRVRMPMSGARPDLPAIWMLNAQVMYVGQYSPCNCRGMGSAGGCGELDIAEVIENQNPLRDRVSTHHYFYDGAVPNPLHGDNYATRPTTRAATYVTIIDATVGDGLIKILEIEDDDGLDFTATQLTNAQVEKWIRA